METKKIELLLVLLILTISCSYKRYNGDITHQEAIASISFCIGGEACSSFILFNNNLIVYQNFSSYDARGYIYKPKQYSALYHAVISFMEYISSHDGLIRERERAEVEGYMFIIYKGNKYIIDYKDRSLPSELYGLISRLDAVCGRLIPRYCSMTSYISNRKVYR